MNHSIFSSEIISKKILRRFTFAGTLFVLANCTHSIHHVHVSDFTPYQPKQAGQIVAAKTEQFVVLGFASETNYVNRAYRELQEKCTGGEIQGITTQFSTSHGFFSWTNKILMQGLCVKG